MTLKYWEIKARKSAVLAKDVATQLPGWIGKSGIYNLTDGQNPLFSEIEDAIAKASNKRIGIRLPLFFLRVLAVLGDGIRANWIAIPAIFQQIKQDDCNIKPLVMKKQKRKLGWQPSPVVNYIEQGGLFE